MRSIFCFFTILCILGRSWQVEPQMPRFLGMFETPHAGFVEVFDREDGGKDLYLTTFNPALPFFHDPVFFLRDPGQYIDDVASWPDHFETLGSKASAYWPNFPVQVPKEVLGFEAMVQTSGFLVPGKTNGKIELFNTSVGAQGETLPIDIAYGARDGHDWSYHWVIWRDIDNDGLLDAMTARFRVPTFGDPISQLIWLKNPGTAPPTPGTAWEWQWFLASEGPDVYFEEQVFEVCNPDCFEYSAIVTAELWTERVMIYFVVNEPGAWGHPNNVQSMVIDTGVGQCFEAHWADLNNDGVMEILASCYDTVNETGNFFVYQQDWANTEKPWKKSVIKDGFIANSYLFGNSMTPGKSRLFWPSEEYKSTPTEYGPVPKPWIALSGDDDGVHYLLFPKSEDPENMEYDLQVMVDSEATTSGTMAITDIDGDGYVEIISAGYTAGEVYVYTFAPYPK